MPTFLVSCIFAKQKKRQQSMMWMVHGQQSVVEIQFTKTWDYYAAYHDRITCEKYVFDQSKR